MAAFPESWFTVLADHPGAMQALSSVMEESGQTVGVMLDVDVGQHRTGIAPGEGAVNLYQEIARLPGLEPRGLHVYDGHTHQSDPAERAEAVRRQLQPALALRAELERKGLPVPAITAGGTPTFPIYATMDLPGLELSPGTCLLHDHGYGSRFPDLARFIPAAVLLTRVISKPTPTRLTLDLGYKAVASDPPAGKRLIMLNFPGEYEQILQNEEHLVLETAAAGQFQPGDEFFAIPTHICPTCAMHQQAYVIEDGHVTDHWHIVGRDRVLTV
jgi:D-serine deaminase-like pyridoxal phosphate-dependent protein